MVTLGTKRQSAVAQVLGLKGCWIGAVPLPWQCEGSKSRGTVHPRLVNQSGCLCPRKPRPTGA